jgi:very-short-patch-repair endonuclease
VGVKKVETNLKKRNKIAIAKKLRINSTDTEKYLWKYLRGKQLTGFKFRRQHPIGKYVIDFVNLERRIIIELDGGQHLENKKDKLRDKWLKERGYDVLRFWDNEVLTNVEGVLEVIREKILSPSPPYQVRGRLNPLPPRGEGSNLNLFFVFSLLETRNL